MQVENAHALDIGLVLEHVQSGARGISESEAQKRLAQSGPNELVHKKPVSAWRVFVRQFQNPLTLILLLAGVLSFWVGEWLETLAIAAIALINSTLGFLQEYQAERAMELLKEMAPARCRVRRDGVVRSMHASELALGDHVLFEAGDIVPADVRLLAASELEIDESMLTGESQPSEKFTHALPEKTGVADRENMAYAGTVVTRGTGEGVVVSTGMRTEFGRIAGQLQNEPDSVTPLQIQFERLTSQIGIAAAVLIALIVVTGMLQPGHSLAELLVFALILATATIPSALPLIVNISLARGSKTLSERNMLVKKLPAAESLGAVTVICTDKTGTLTQNKMSVVAGWTLSGSFSPTDAHKAPEGFDHVIFVAGACNNAEFGADTQTAASDPTEIALARFAHDNEFEGMNAGLERLYEFPFDSERKRMSVIVRMREGERRVLVKGAADLLLERCTHAWNGREVVELDDSLRARIQTENERLGDRALRVLATAYRQVDADLPQKCDEAESGLVFAGLTALWDPPREGVHEAISRCKTAGIRIVMVTGDQAATAHAIAEHIGLWEKDDRIVQGHELQAWSDADLEREIGRIRVVARALPADKVRIVRAFQKTGNMVAVTGDGVNDAPALKVANVGIAMGISGTEVTKEVADAILTDDHFASIVNAVEEGRAIYDKIIKSARYLLSCNAGEIFTVLLAVFLSLPLPLLPLQVLFINIVTDTFPAMGLGNERAEPDIMGRPPRKPGARPLSNASLVQILLLGLLMAGVTLALFMHYLSTQSEKAQTVAFTTLVFLQIVAVISNRRFSFEFSALDLRTNLLLAGGIAAALILQVGVIYLEPAQALFKTVALDAADWAIILAAGVLSLALSEGVRRMAASKKQLKPKIAQG